MSDLTGARFGLLEVTKKLPIRYRGDAPRYDCLCHGCGCELDIPTQTLLRGMRLCCGWRACRVKAGQDPDPAGTVYGKLVVQCISPSDRPGAILRYQCLCTGCGELTDVTVRSLTEGRSRSCGKPGCREVPHAERIVCGDGYAYLWAPDHPKSHQNRVREHVLVMERKLGRYLTDDELVHHRNRIRDDNRESNLELWTNSHPTTARVEDVVTWAKEILALYDR